MTYPGYTLILLELLGEVNLIVLIQKGSATGWGIRLVLDMMEI